MITYAADTPTAGFYRMRLARGGAFVGIRVWYGAPLDPETGEEMDRSWRWQATANGEPINLDRVWPACGNDPISKADHDHLAKLQAWARDHAPESGLADPRQRLDPLSTPMMF